MLTFLRKYLPSNFLILSLAAKIQQKAWLRQIFFPSDKTTRINFIFCLIYFQSAKESQKYKRKTKIKSKAIPRIEPSSNL